MAIVDTITSMQTHTSNAYDMLEYETDLTGTNKNLQNLSTSIFKAFIESLNNPDTLWGNLPKITGTGTNISLNNTIQAPMKIEYNPSEISQSGTPTPSSPQDIHTISGNNTIKVNGENFFNSQVITNATTIETDGTIVLTNTTSSANGYKETGKSLSQLCPDLKVGDTAYLYIDTDFYYNGSKRALIYCTANWNNGTSKTITEVMLNAVVVIYGGYQTTSHIKIMITKGSVANAYKPYITPNTYPINLDFDYCKIGNYEDRIFKNVSGDTDYSSDREDGAWYIKKNIGKVVLDGTEGWGVRGGTRYTTQITTNMPSNSGTGATNYGFSNYYESNVSWDSNKDMTAIVYKNSGWNYANVQISNSSIANTTDLKTWLSTHNTIIYYIMGTPTYTKITGELANQLEAVKYSMEGTTNISQVNNDLPFELSVSALEDLR